LSEIWVNDEKERIRRELSDIYSYYMQGPDEADLDRNGGLLLLSKYPIINSSYVIYRDCAGEDCLTNKGAFYVMVHPPSSAVPWNLFFSHTQNNTPMTASAEDGVKALYAQLMKLGEFVQTYSAAPFSVENSAYPTIIVGDFNVNSGIKERYD
jgi:hypothetical protein